MGAGSPIHEDLLISGLAVIIMTSDVASPPQLQWSTSVNPIALNSLLHNRGRKVSFRAGAGRGPDRADKLLRLGANRTNRRRNFLPGFLQQTANHPRAATSLRVLPADWCQVSAQSPAPTSVVLRQQSAKKSNPAPVTRAGQQKPWPKEE